MPVDPGARLWREVTNRLAREVSIRTTATYLRYAEGALSLDEAIGITASLIAAAQRRAVTANDVLLAAELTRQLESEHTATGMQWMETPDEQVARLSRAVTTVVGDDIAYIEAAAGKTREQVLAMTARSIRARLGRLTDSEVVGASQWSRQTAMQIWEERGVIRGWYRRLSPGACDWCKIMGGSPPDKYIRPVQHRLPTHPKCRCSQGWVTDLEPGMVWLGPRQQMRDLPGAEDATTVDRTQKSTRA